MTRIRNAQHRVEGKTLHLTGGLAKLGCKVILRLRSVTIIRISVRPLIVGNNPNGVQSNPNFAKPPGRYLQAAKARWSTT